MIYHIHCTAFLSRHFLVLISLQSIVWWLKVKTVTVTVTVHTSTKISFSIVFRSTQYKLSSALSDISAIPIPFSLRIPMDFLWKKCWDCWSPDGTRPHRAMAPVVVHVVLVPWDGQGVPRWGNYWLCGGGFPEIQGFNSFLTSKKYGYIYIYVYI